METLLAYRDGELTAGQAVKTAEHVERCPWCPGHLSQIEIDAERLQAAVTQPLAENHRLAQGLERLTERLHGWDLAQREVGRFRNASLSRANILRLGSPVDWQSARRQPEGRGALSAAKTLLTVFLGERGSWPAAVATREHGINGGITVHITETEREVAALYDAHGPGLLRYALTLVSDAHRAQDALQEIFLRYFVACSEGRTVLHPKAWLFQVLRNYLLDALKSYGVKNEVAIEEIRDSPDHGQDPEQHYQHTEVARDLNRLLSPRERECVRLRGEGFSYDEIAGIMNLRKGTVGATLSRAHKKFRRALGRTAEEKRRAAPRACALAREEDSYAS